MERKKSKKADLERKKSLFLQIGFTVALGLVLLAFEWATRPEKAEGFEQQEDDVVQEDVPVTRQEEKKPPPPPPPKTTDVLNIVEDDVQIEDELRLEETEADQDTEVSIDAFAEEEEEEEQKIFVVVEDMPTFKGGGLNAFRNYVQRNIDYPTVAAENGIEGTVFVKFVVDQDGSISNVTTLRGVDPSLDEEAMRVIRNAPEWEPGQQRGKPVRVQFTIPISFQLN